MVPDLSIRMIEGELPIEKIVITEGEAARSQDWKITARAGVIATKTI